MSAPVIAMPARGDRSAPKFDPKQPRELRRYFIDLNFHIGRAGAMTEEAKKGHACRFVDVDTGELWESLPAFSDQNLDFAAFVKAVHALYPGSEEERKWSVADMDKLVGERSRLGVISLGDLGEYYRQFLAITTFLLAKERLSEAEQSRAFVRGLQPELWLRISHRLQLKKPDHYPDDPYSLKDIHEAAVYVLHGTPSAFLATSVTTTTPAPSAAVIKAEDLTAMMERMTESFIKAVTAHTGGISQVERPPRFSGPGSGNCNFCGGPGHFMRECTTAIEYIEAGKCKKNIEGKITLPSGAFIPQDIPSPYFRDCLDEWHRRNPGQVGAAQMMYRVLANGISDYTGAAQPTIATRHTHPKLFDTTYEPQLMLSTQDRIDSLERELFTLRGRKNDPPIRTRAQRQAAGERLPSVEIEEEPRPKQRLVPEVVIPKALPKPPSDPRLVPRPESPIHPFANVKDATYAAPHERNFGGLPKPAAPKKAEPAYRTLPPVYDGKVAAEVYDRAMATPVTLTQRELLSLSPEVRSQMREATSAKRAPPKEAAADVHTLATDSMVAAAIDDLDSEPTALGGTTATFVNSIRQPTIPPPGALVIEDAYDVYLKSLPQGTTPDVLMVAKESSALRSIRPLIDHQQHVEAIIDPGSQIIAMAEEICIDLGLIYDPTVILNMQSANGEIDKSLGLARNVPMRIGDITLYVQIHIIRSPAYDILLGRPFDILTESVVRNFANEDQTITIFDPNTGQRATVPTQPRGKPRQVLQRPLFMTSRI